MTTDTYVPTTQEPLGSLLNSLDTKGLDGIREYFADSGIKGIRMRACECPVARYLRSETGAAVVSVGTRWTHIPKPAQGDDPSFVPTPKNVSDFVFAFDMGMFPELEG